MIPLLGLTISNPPKCVKGSSKVDDQIDFLFLSPLEQMTKVALQGPDALDRDTDVYLDVGPTHVPEAIW